MNHSPSDAQPGQKIEHGELILGVDEAKRQLNAQNLAFKVLETPKVPGTGGGREHDGAGECHRRGPGGGTRFWSTSTCQDGFGPDSSVRNRETVGRAGAREM
ncbi:MAG: hypothetical protein LC796_00860 [Acidobacteria bacterium]|nr:hypothetical protein [Acidobacteriota bacterium]